MNFTPAGAVDVDKHDKVKKMFSPVRKILNVVKIVNVSPTKEKNPPRADEDVLDKRGSDDDPEQDEASVAEESSRRECHDNAFDL